MGSNMHVESLKRRASILDASAFAIWVGKEKTRYLFRSDEALLEHKVHQRILVIKHRC